MRRAQPLLVLLALALGGCSWLGDKPEPTGPVYSPNGEPLSGGPLGHPDCEAANARWFDRVAKTPDAGMELGEFLADAKRQFAVMDLDKDGTITPSELAHYRAPYAGDRPRREEEVESPRADGRREDKPPPMSRDRVDPVMLADVTLRNRVSLDEFIAYARRNFAALDANRDGRLTRAELERTCKP